MAIPHGTLSRSKNSLTAYDTAMTKWRMPADDITSWTTQPPSRASPTHWRAAMLMIFSADDEDAAQQTAYANSADDCAPLNIHDYFHE